MPFTVEQFLDVFQVYNQAIWPLQLLAYALGGMAVVLAFKPTAWSHRAISGILAAFWVWMGLVYHIMYFSAINEAAFVFGAFFIVQGLLFLLLGIGKKQLAFHFEANVYGITGGLLIVYAMIVYPVLGAFLGHGYPFAPMFGVAPCPTTIFTFGLLLWTHRRVPKLVLVIPAVWSVIGLSAAINLGVREDVGLLVAGVLAVGLLLYRDRASKETPAVAT